MYVPSLYITFYYVEKNKINSNKQTNKAFTVSALCPTIFYGFKFSLHLSWKGSVCWWGHVCHCCSLGHPLARWERSSVEGTSRIRIFPCELAAPQGMLSYLYGSRGEKNKEITKETKTYPMFKRRLSSGKRWKLICERYHCIMQMWKNIR